MENNPDAIRGDITISDFEMISSKCKYEQCLNLEMPLKMFYKVVESVKHDWISWRNHNEFYYQFNLHYVNQQDR